MFVTAGLEDEISRRLGMDVSWPMKYWPWLTEITQITHYDFQALYGVTAVYRAAEFAEGGRGKPFDSDGALLWLNFCWTDEDDFSHNLNRIEPAYRASRSLSEFAAELNLSRGVTGYIAHTVPVAIYAFLKHPDDYRSAIESVIRLGGDTDTVAAITGALVGIRVGKAGIPPEWLNRYADWPRSVAWMESLGERLAEGSWRETPQPAVRLAWWVIPFRNFVFFLIVLGHIFRRMLPPY